MFFAFLKRYVPRGIYGRAALIVLLPVAVLQLVVTVIYAQRHFEGVTLQMTDTVARELRLVLKLAEATEERDEITDRVAQELGLLQINATPVAAMVPGDDRVWYDYSGAVLTPRLKELVPAVHRVDLTVDGGVAVYADTRHGPLQLTFDRRRISAANPHQLFVYTIFFSLVLTLVAVVYLRNQLRPIKRLARAAEAFGKGRSLPFSPAGAVEVRAAGNAFVNMRNRIERQIEQRTLMLSGVSHDMRTPLTRMRLSLAMLEDAEREPLEQDVADLQSMLDAFLNFTKGAGEGEPVPIDPYVLVNDIVQTAQRAGQKVTLLPQQGDGTGVVALNETAIRRAVNNLINNAVRYGDAVEVSVRLSEKSLRIRVEDDGPGIPEERRAEAMRPFTRLDPARNLDRGGSVGLGLAIAIDIARAHGGVLRLGVSDHMGGLRADIVIGR